MRIYCDSSTYEACVVVEGQTPVLKRYPQRVTNNVGEYLAVLFALEWVERLGLTEGEILTDSLLVVNQVEGQWKCRSARLVPLRDNVRHLLREYAVREYTGRKYAVRDCGVWERGTKLIWTPRYDNLAGRELERLDKLHRTLK